MSFPRPTEWFLYLSYKEQMTLASLAVSLLPYGLSFGKRLSKPQMMIVGHIIANLVHRTGDIEEYVPILIGDWAVQYEDTLKEDGSKAFMMLKYHLSHSCFISYSNQDQIFADKLYTNLTRVKIRAWYAPHHMGGGKKIYNQLDAAIQEYDRLIIVLSENSLASEWVMTEIRRARQIEVEGGKQKLFPIRLIDMNTLKKWKCFDADIGKDLAVEIREYHIPDFSNWQDDNAFHLSFSKIIDDLKR